MMRMIIIRLLGLLAATAGCFVWTSRLDYSPESVLQKWMGDRLLVLDGNEITDLSAACNVFTDSSPWVVFVLDANLAHDASPRAYFETSSNEVQALWAEYDPPLLRIGLGIELGNVASTSDIPIRIVRRNERATVVIAVQESGTQVVTNATIRKSSWPGTGGGVWRCNAVRIGSDQRELSSGNNCKNCDARLRYATGTDQQLLRDMLSELDNTKRFQIRRWIGTSLTVLGLAAILSPIRWLNRQRNQRSKS